MGETLIREWFSLWLNKNNAGTCERKDDIFSHDIVYTECYGPQYHGTEQIKLWFNDWNQHGTVLRWDIRQIICQNDIYAAEWYFECDYEGNVSGFDGVSLVRIRNGRISELSEYQSKSEHVYPYR